MKVKAFFITLFLMYISGNSFAGSGAGKDVRDFRIKAFHIDLHIQVMKPEALKSFVDELAEFGINTIIMEWEASYPYGKHATLSNELAYTREEVKSFIDYCHSKRIDVIPLQQCFGHVEYILRNKRYSYIREEKKEISQLCPLQTTADSLLFADLFQDLSDMHGSKYIHIGGDETYLLGHCKACSEKANNEGKSKLFVDYMRMITGMVIKMGKTPVMWADIVLKYPEAADQLPKETIFVDWNYGWKVNFFGDIAHMQEKGFKFWGAASIRSSPDDWFVNSWEKHLNNQRDFIPYTRNASYDGIIMTSWSTTGIYGYIWDNNYELVDMESMRNTYPLSGFRILVAAYARSLKQKEPIDPKRFVIEYAQERFGLSEMDGESFWGALTVKPVVIIDGKPADGSSINELKEENATVKNILYKLKPIRNQKEFEHFRLMADLRDYYLSFKEIEAIYNSNQYAIVMESELIPVLKGLKLESKSLDQRFRNLQKGFLYDSEIENQNRIRQRALNILYNRVTKAGK